jgi:flagellar protein FliJ
MKVFSFRLQKVLEYRAMSEEWAKQAYLDARAARLEAELLLIGLGQRRQELLNGAYRRIEDRLNLEAALNRLDEEEAQQRVALSVLQSEEERAMAEWTERRRDLQVVEKLRDRALEEWRVEASRQEQAELDEWAVLRRAA